MSAGERASMFEPFVAWAVKRLAPMYARFVDARAFAGRIRDHYQEQWTTRTDPAHCLALARRLAILGRRAEDYAVRLIDLGALGQVMAGIHFFGMDHTKPFVGVLAQSRDLDDAELEPFRARLCEEFALFVPSAVWIFVAGHESQLPRVSGARSDQRVHIGSIAALGDSPVPPGYERMTLAAPSSGMYERYVEAYEQVFAERTDLRGLVPVQDRDSLDNAEACFEAWIDDQWAGLVAAGTGDFMGLSGYYVLDEVLAARFRGQGLGPVLQRRLLDELARRPLCGDGLLWGTIDARNQPSRRTAARVGREDVGGWAFVDRPWTGRATRHSRSSSQDRH